MGTTAWEGSTPFVTMTVPLSAAMSAPLVVSEVLKHSTEALASAFKFLFAA